ncbi:MAG: UDP-N-acetylmuramate dehydrogenase [Candidatus Krumholzibacteria bacterium]|jgi:UDP-N-acetylmuramate dehydrogenase|nr:UDP-N-acetylmuramate dehydrogenase [Candidatus Krumholzibacteria bacterium]MDP6669821.1 UDP-N-acetylmuramate dehydrogenase [Candidatus Krumholzibacteria bacterium]MDP6796484.1 UDP-N-acetylmuramate dehydrogenase [Candidatus Krumholzibacteria bacterium]MDP7021614.1 UDP-N-acetylmuramate dehydrogenase [Candidatus Krumholzibacteria bacterium]
MEAAQNAYAGPWLAEHPLAPLSSFRVGGKADWLVEPGEEEAGPLLARLRELQVPVTFLGEGSNVLIRDGGIRGVVLRVGKALSWIRFEGDYASCGAGLSSSRLARLAREEGRGGFAWAASLPGNLGGAVRMNAGCFGGEIGEVFHSLSGWTLGGERRLVSAEEIEFRYRHSSLPGDFLVTSLKLRLPLLSSDERSAMEERFREVQQTRARSQPGGLFTAGSTFRNPPGDSAGRLLEQCGLKGRSVGGAMVSERHANFIEARGEKVLASDIESLMQIMAEEVERQTGIRLKREVVLLGEA